jgi:hypothetical protein
MLFVQMELRWAGKTRSCGAPGTEADTVGFAIGYSDILNTTSFNHVLETRDVLYST